MDIIGKIIQKLPLQSGTSKAGNAWSKQIYILETLDAYPKKVAFDFFGDDRIKQYEDICSVGNTITLSCDIESREFNGRWYTDVRGWKAEKYNPEAAAAPQAAPAQYAAPAAGQAPYAGAPTQPAPAPPAPAPDFSGGADEDLPF